MRAQLEALLEFHRTFGAYVSETPTGKLPPQVRELRIRLIQEEMEEYADAARRGDLVAVADALTDLLYVVLGAMVAHGLQDVAEALFAEVHRSNMSKAGPDGLPLRREDGKILKPPTYSPPDLVSILKPWLEGQGQDRECSENPSLRGEGHANRYA